MRGIIILMFIWVHLAARAYLVDDFAQGIQGWQSSGNVFVDQEEAVLDDSTSYRSHLGKSTDIQGFVSVSFELKTELAEDVPQGAFLDAFFASIFFFLDPQTFNPSDTNTFLSAIGLLDADALGFYDVNGLLGPSLRGAGWMEYTGTFSSAAPHAAIVYELFDTNTESGDSTVRIDNVQLVPEPGMTGLLLTAFLCLRLIRARGPGTRGPAL